MKPNESHRTLLHRRDAFKTLLLPAAAAAAQQPQAPPGPEKRLSAWMYMIYPLEQWLTDYRRILENLRRRFVITYTSTNRRHDGGWRTVQIVPTREGIAIDSKGGYFAPEEP